MDWRCVAFAYEFAILAHKVPSAILPQIGRFQKFFLRKLLFHAVVFIHESRFVHIAFGIGRNGHSFADIRTDFVRSEIEQRQEIQAVERERHRDGEEREHQQPTWQRRQKIALAFLGGNNNDGEQQQEKIFPKCLPISDDDGIAKAAAVRHGIFQRNPERERRVEKHKGKTSPARLFQANAEKYAAADAEFQRRHTDGGRQRQVVELREVPRLEIVVHFVRKSERVDGFDKPRKDECDTEQQATHHTQSARNIRLFESVIHGYFPPSVFSCS